jgi:hypothetical protein
MSPVQMRQPISKEQLHDVLVQQYQILEKQSQTLRMHLAAQQHAARVSTLGSQAETRSATPTRARPPRRQISDSDSRPLFKRPKSKPIIIKNPNGEVVDFKQKISTPLPPTRPMLPVTASSTVDPVGSCTESPEAIASRRYRNMQRKYEVQYENNIDAKKTEGQSVNTEAKTAEEMNSTKEAENKTTGDMSEPDPFKTFSKIRKHVAHDVFPAESSRDDNSHTIRSSSIVPTESTSPTSISGETLSAKRFYQTQPIQSSIVEEEELFKEGSHSNLHSDGQSTISADSVIALTFDQKNSVVEKFSKALLRDLPIKCFASDSEDIEVSTFRNLFSESVKTYSKKVMADAERRSRRRQASKAIRFVRNDIIRKCYETLGGFRHPQRRKVPSIVNALGQHNILEKTVVEKVSEWRVGLLERLGGALEDPISFMPLSRIKENDTSTYRVLGQYQKDKSASDVGSLSDITEQSFSHGSQISRDDGDISLEDKDVYAFLTEHSAFSELVDDLRTLVERHFCDQKELIHHRILLAIRRPSNIEQFSKGSFHASFHVDWNVIDFLQTGYSLQQDIRHVITITGTPVNAQLTTVEAYLEQTWPLHTWELVNALNTTIAASIRGIRVGKL